MLCFGSILCKVIWAHFFESFNAEMEFSRTSLASRTHFEVLFLSLEAFKSSKMPSPRPKTALFFKITQNGPWSWSFFCLILKNARNLAENLWNFFSFFGGCLQFRGKFLVSREKTVFFVIASAFCPWSLASRKSILKKLVLGLGFFLSLWPWPRTLDSWVHLCLKYLSRLICWD